MKIISPNRIHNKKYFYKYTSASTAQKILINKSVRFSSPFILNDPFDIQRELKFDFEFKDFEVKIKNEIINMINNEIIPKYSNNLAMQVIFNYISIMNKEEKAKYCNEIKNTKLKNLYELDSFKLIQQKWNDFLPITRIFSVSEDYDNTVMWTHYADKYKGVVLELECIDIYDNVLLAAEKVKYSDKIPTIGALDYWIKVFTDQEEFNYEKTFKELELTKSSNWSYEKEWRVIIFEKDSKEYYNDYKIHPRTFSKIFLGKEISDDDRKIFKKLIFDELSHIELLNMEYDYKNKNIIFKKNAT